MLKVDRNMSTAYHPQTDGQTERVNQSVEAYLRQFCNYEQNDWVEILPMAEYAYNNSATTAHGLTPFYANYGYHPRTNWPVEAEAKNPAGRNYAHWMSSVHEWCLERLKDTSERMKKYYDVKVKEAPQYRVGDLVMLNGKHLKTRRPCKKLDHKLQGPFKVAKILSPSAVKLTLPSTWGGPRSFHVSLLEPYRSSKKGLREPPDPDVVMRDADELDDDEGLWEIDEVIGSSIDSEGTVKYLTKWVGYPDPDNWTEEPYENFAEGSDGLGALRTFHRKFPNAARDMRMKMK